MITTTPALNVAPLLQKYIAAASPRPSSFAAQTIANTLQSEEHISPFRYGRFR